MNDAEVERFKVMLAQRRAALVELEDDAAEAAKPVELDQASVGRLSRMDAMRAQQMAQENERRRKRQLAAIDAALRRIAGGEFGYCMNCGEEIDVRRLVVDPTHTRCIGCAE